MKNKKRMMISLFAVGQLFFWFFWSTAFALSACPEFPFVQPTTGPLAVVNCDFHKQYEKRINQVISTFGAPNGRPVILNLGGTLLLKRNGNTTTVNITPSPYHEIKTFAHAALTVFVTLSQQAPEVSWDEKTQNTLKELLMHLQEAKANLAAIGLSNEDRLMSEQIATVTEEYLNKVLADRRYAQKDLLPFYQKTKPSMTMIIQRAAQAELQTLDHTVTAWLGEMAAAEKEQLGVVIATAHQARAREISLQYFEKKLGFHVGEGAQHENGFVVLEGKFDEKSALALLARHYVDREAAQSIFQDPARLQEDLLGQAAADVLRRM